jgi:hypothetical protein
VTAQFLCLYRFYILGYCNELYSLRKFVQINGFSNEPLPPPLEINETENKWKLIRLQSISILYFNFSLLFINYSLLFILRDGFLRYIAEYDMCFVNIYHFQ